MYENATEKRHHEEYQAGICRPICAKRKRKLQKRGEHIEWSTWFDKWVWYPEDKPSPIDDPENYWLAA